MMPTLSVFSKSVKDAISYCVVIGSSAGDSSFLLPPCKVITSHSPIPYPSLSHYIIFSITPAITHMVASLTQHIEFEKLSRRSHGATSLSKDNVYGTKPKFGNKCGQGSIQRSQEWCRYCTGENRKRRIQRVLNVAQRHMCLWLWRTAVSCFQDVCGLAVKNVEGMWSWRVRVSGLSTGLWTTGSPV